MLNIDKYFTAFYTNNKLCKQSFLGVKGEKTWKWLLQLR